MRKTSKTTALTALLLTAVLLGCLLIPAIASADNMYVIPDSDRRELTYDELWEYKYNTLLYAYNEILARHGYKVETGSRCYHWFTQMPWYHPNENESSSNHSATYSQMSALENRNFNLIKQVYREMREMGMTNKGGKGMPTPPAQNVDKPRGFEYVDLKAGQKLAVYTAPGGNAYRANNGKAMCSTNGAVYGLGWEDGWLLMLYEANRAGQYRVGYVYSPQFKKGAVDDLGELFWNESECEVLMDAAVTDDPAETGVPLMYLQAGDHVTYLTTMYNSGAWDYIETTLNGQTLRGFVQQGALSITAEDPTEAIDPGNG